MKGYKGLSAFQAARVNERIGDDLTQRGEEGAQYFYRAASQLYKSAKLNHKAGRCADKAQSLETVVSQ